MDLCNAEQKDHLHVHGPVGNSLLFCKGAGAVPESGVRGTNSEKGDQRQGE